MTTPRRLVPRLCGGKIRAPLLHIRDRGQPRKVSFKERERREPRGRRQGEGVENDNRETLSFREEAGWPSLFQEKGGRGGARVLMAVRKGSGRGASRHC